LYRLQTLGWTLLERETLENGFKPSMFRAREKALVVFLFLVVYIYIYIYNNNNNNRKIPK